MDEPSSIAVLGGLIIGALFGAIVQRTNFCIMGAVADFALSGSLLRMRAWMLAIAIAIVSSQALELAGIVDLATTIYRVPTLPIGGLLIGGLMFGFGMVISCGCSSRSLVNAASGDLRALTTVLIIGISGYMTIRGLLAWPRLWFTDATQVPGEVVPIDDQSIGAALAAVAGVERGLADLIAAALVSIALFLFVFLGRDFWRQRRYQFGAVALGLLIGASWWLTGVLALDEFDPRPPQSLRFVASIGDSLQFLMLTTGYQATFAIAAVGGVLFGAFAAAVSSGTFAIRAFEDRHDMLRYLTGGGLMGIGGVLSLGCTVGQGMSGISTLSLGSVVATASIIAGGILGVRYLEQGSLRGALRAVLVG